MDEDKTKVTNPTTPQEPAVEETAEVKEDVVEEEADTQPASKADVDKETGEEQVSSPVSKEENDKRSEQGKMSKLEKERNELAQRVKLLEALDAAAAEDPEFMKLANKKLFEKGLLDEATYKQLEGADSQVVPDEVAKHPAVLWAEQQRQKEVASKEKFFEDFESRHPDLTEGTPEIIRANRTAIGAVAAKRIAEGVSQAEAFEFAYKSVMNPTLLVEEGKLQGLAQAQTTSSTEGAASGGVAKSSGGVELTPEQKDMARRFGVTEEEYAKSLES